jgi:hypothetical protein
MQRQFSYLAMAGTLVLASAPAYANPVVLTGKYIKAGISDYGTLGSNGGVSPGLIHDPTGTGTFDPSTDYVSPGTPHEGFSVNSAQTGFLQNDNNFIKDFATIVGGGPTILTGAAALGFANAATWTGANDFLRITNSYFFNPGDERINVVTTITALSNITGLAFARSVDPDSGGAGDPTNNQLGNSLFGATDFVGSASAINGRTLALVNLSGNTYVHNTQINGSCCSNIDPLDVLAGNGALGSTSAGDDGLNMAWSIGDLAAGNSAVIKYAYAVGLKIDVVGGDPTPAVPEPATWAMMLVGFGMMGGTLRYRRRSMKVAYN